MRKLPILHIMDMPMVILMRKFYSSDLCGLYDSLMDNGYFIIDSNFLNDSLLQALISIIPQSHEDGLEGSQYEGGKLEIYDQIFFDKNNDRRYEPIREFIGVCNSILYSAEVSHLKHIATFRTLDTPKSHHIAQLPHFDRIPTLKFMLYLNNITPKNGAFWLAAGSHRWVNKILPTPRPPHHDDAFYNQTRNIPLHIRSALRPISGPKGTIIVFDTDCVHHQGIVLSGQCNILRSHFR